jgi:C1A family cysteine protease
MRFGRWGANHRLVSAHNSQQPPPSYTLEMNAFAHLSFEEFSSIYLSVRAPSGQGKLRAKTPTRTPSATPTARLAPSATPTISLSRSAPPSPGSAPPTTDWLAAPNTVVVPVRDQMQCGACWAFSAAEAYGSAVALKTGLPVVAFSEQQLVSCSTSFGNSGCAGGWMVSAFQYIKTLPQGLCLATQYPYTSGTGSNGACAIPASCSTLTTPPIKIIVEVTSGAPGATAQGDTEAALAKQPLSVAVTASSAFQLYAGGTFSSTTCADSAVNHAVLLVGTTAGTYTIQNSWGTGWGTAGRMVMAKGPTYNPRGVCNIQRCG